VTQSPASKPMRRTGPLARRVALAVQRGLMVRFWRVCERFGIDAGATEGPPYVVDAARKQAFEQLIAAASAGDGTIDASMCPYPAHELLTYLVLEHDVLLHGSNDTDLEVLEPRPAHDFGTELHAVVATDDGIWPLFYAVISRRQVDGVFTACMHLGRRPRLRRFYMFVVFAQSSEAAVPWTRGVMYCLPRATFRREWGNEWVSPVAVRPRLRVLVGPDDFPLAEAVLVVTPDDAGRVLARLRAAKRERMARPGRR
jgi:hypothetical protein